MGSAVGRVAGFFAAPVRDFFGGFERCLDRGVPALILILVGLVVGWWLYVPLHELLHAFACLAAGGSVTRLEIAELYGGSLLEGWIPFVVAGSEYAGRLSGFDTGGSDLVYLLTDLGPFVLTLFPGVWALRRAGQLRWPFAFGFWLPFALAPFLSLTGDAYEIGSLAVTALPPWSGEAAAAALRSDDLFRLAGELAEHPDPPWLGAAVATAVGVLWAFATYALGGAVARLLEHRRRGAVEVAG
jgi:hypothetical protein